MANGDTVFICGWETGDNSAWLTDFNDTTWAKTFPAGRTGLCMQVSGGGTDGESGSYVAHIFDSSTGNSRAIGDVGLLQSHSFTNTLGLIRIYHRITGFPAGHASQAEAGRIIRVLTGVTTFFDVSISRAVGVTSTIKYTLPGGAVYDTGSVTGDSTWRRIELLIRGDNTSCHARLYTVDSNTVLAESVQYLAGPANWPPDTIRVGFIPNGSTLQHATHTHQFDDLTIITNVNTAITTWLGDGKIRGPATATGAGSFAEWNDDATPATDGTAVFGNLTEAWPTPDQTSYNITATATGLKRDAWAMTNAAGLTGTVRRWGLHTFAAGTSGSNLQHFAGLYSGGAWLAAQHHWTNSDATWRYGTIHGNIADTTAFDAAEVGYYRALSTYRIQMSAVQVEYEDDQGLTPDTIAIPRSYATVIG